MFTEYLYFILLLQITPLWQKAAPSLQQQVHWNILTSLQIVNIFPGILKTWRTDPFYQFKIDPSKYLLYLHVKMPAWQNSFLCFVLVSFLQKDFIKELFLKGMFHVAKNRIST